MSPAGRDLPKLFSSSSPQRLVWRLIQFPPKNDEALFLKEPLGGYKGPQVHSESANSVSTHAKIRFDKSNCI